MAALPQVKFSDLRSNFGSVLERGKAVEVKQNYAVVAVISPNIEGVTSEYTYPEHHVALNLHQVFELVHEGKKVVVERLSGKRSFVISKPHKDKEPA